MRRLSDCPQFLFIYPLRLLVVTFINQIGMSTKIFQGIYNYICYILYKDTCSRVQLNKENVELL